MSADSKQKNRNRQAVLFDFDGTLVDSFDILVSVSNTLLGQMGRVALSDEKVDELRQHSARKALSIMDIPRWRLPVFAYKAKKLAEEQRDKIKPIEGIEAALQSLSERGIDCYVVSSNTAETIRIHLERAGLLQYFSGVEATGLFNKAKTIRKIKKDYAHVVYVGDEIRDIDAAKEAAVPVLAVNWGFNTHEALEKAKPTAICDHPNMLAEAIRAML